MGTCDLKIFLIDDRYYKIIANDFSIDDFHRQLL